MRLSSLRIGLFCTLVCSGVFGQEQKEKPKEAFVKIFNACQRSGGEQWQTGLDLKFHGKPLASDVRVGEAGLVRQITFFDKDSVDVFRCGRFTDKGRDKPESPASPAAQIRTSFEPQSITLLLVHGRLDVGETALEIEAIREFPVPPESVHPGMARILLLNVWPGGNVELEHGAQAPVSLSPKMRREVFLQPGETEILVSYTGKDGQIKKQMAVFKLVADCSYTGIVYPAAEIPDRPCIRLSDSNEGWATIRSLSKEVAP